MKKGEKKGRPDKFGVSQFIAIANDYTDYLDDRGIRKRSSLTVGKVYDFYLKFRDKKKYPSISRATFYNQPELAKYLHSLEDGVVDITREGIVKNDEYVFEEFDWAEWLRLHESQSDVGLKMLGSIINQHRHEIRCLLNRVDDLEEKLKTIKIAKSAEECIIDATKQKEESEKVKSYRNLYLEYKGKYEHVRKYLSKVEREIEQYEYNAEIGIKTIKTEGIKVHSIHGEDDDEPKTMGELEEIYHEKTGDSENTEGVETESQEKTDLEQEEEFNFDDWLNSDGEGEEDDE